MSRNRTNTNGSRRERRGERGAAAVTILGILTVVLAITSAVLFFEYFHSRREKEEPRQEAAVTKSEPRHNSKPEEAPSEEPEEPPVVEEPYEPDFTFSAVDVISGNRIDETIFREHTITMVNIWEPWCGPCVMEMPELERLYEDMQDEGVLILGVYATESGAQEVLRDNGVTYPVIQETPEFYQFETGYVPTSFFVDSSGHLIETSLADERSTLFIGSNTYAGWKNTIEILMRDAEK